MIEKEQTVVRLKRFALADQLLMFRLGLGPKPERPEG